MFSGRGEKIRTSDPLDPIQVRYQAALRPDKNSDLLTLTSDSVKRIKTKDRKYRQL